MHPRPERSRPGLELAGGVQEAGGALGRTARMCSNLRQNCRSARCFGKEKCWATCGPRCTRALVLQAAGASHHGRGALGSDAVRGQRENFETKACCQDQGVSASRRALAGRSSGPRATRASSCSPGTRRLTARRSRPKRRPARRPRRRPLARSPRARTASTRAACEAVRPRSVGLAVRGWPSLYCFSLYVPAAMRDPCSRP